MFRNTRIKIQEKKCQFKCRFQMSVYNKSRLSLETDMSLDDLTCAERGARHEEYFIWQRRDRNQPEQECRDRKNCLLMNCSPKCPTYNVGVFKRSQARSCSANYKKYVTQ